MSTCVICNICVVWCEIISVVILALCDVMCSRLYSVHDGIISEWYTCVLWSQDGVIYADFGRAAWLEFLHVVLNTMCNCIRCYIVWILVLYYVVMCVYVDNYVDNFNINVDNFFVAFATLLRTFWKYCIFACFHTLSLVISRLLLFSHFFIIS